MPSIWEISVRLTSSRYPRTTNAAPTCSVRFRTRAGQPPRQATLITSSVRGPGSSARTGTPANKSRSDTSPVDSPDSKRLIGRIRTRRTRPAPEWRVISSGGLADPVKMNWPGIPRSSQARRMGFQMSGAICHSSSSLGVAPSSMAVGSMLAARRAAAALSSNVSLAAQRRPVQVLPQARGPSIRTAGDAPRAVINSSSITRVR